MNNEGKNPGTDILTSHTGHSLLNVFSTVIANVEMLQEDISFSGRSGRRLERILEASRRGESIVREIRKTAKNAQSKIEPGISDRQVSGRVLVVDDEEDMGEIISRYLGKIGLEVVIETDSIRALERFCDAPDSFSLVISDFDMPHMTGLEFCQHVSTQRSQIPQILITGFDWDFLEEHTENTSISIILRKPLERKIVVNAVQKLLS